ncbi:hypothetical protein LXL04_023015 [Taraxacum kok-saghyz]
MIKVRQAMVLIIDATNVGEVHLRLAKYIFRFFTLLETRIALNRSMLVIGLSCSYPKRERREISKNSSNDVFGLIPLKQIRIDQRESCWDLLRTHIFPRTRELPQFPISPKPLFLSKNRLRNPPKPVLKQNKKLCTYAHKKSLHICKVFGKKKSFFRKKNFATGLIFERFLAPRSRFFEKVNGLGVLGKTKMVRIILVRLELLQNLLELQQPCFYSSPQHTKWHKFSSWLMALRKNKNELPYEAVYLHPKYQRQPDYNLLPPEIRSSIDSNMSGFDKENNAKDVSQYSCYFKF